MNTSKKVKRWQDRTSAASRTRKSKPYHGWKNRLQSAANKMGHVIGEGIPLGYQDRQISTLPYTPLILVSKSRQGDHTHVTAPVREEHNRSTWRDLVRPWRKVVGS